MKKICIVLALLIIGSNVFAQTFSLGGHLATDFENVWPTFEAGINLSHVDILAGVSFWIYQNEFSYDKYSTYNGKLDEDWFRIFAGFAPKVTATEKLALSFPILAKIQVRNDTLIYEDENGYSSENPKKATYSGYGIDFGARVYFALTKKWSIYGGAIMNVLYVADNEFVYWENGPTDTYIRKVKSTDWFTGGLAEMGARVTF